MIEPVKLRRPLGDQAPTASLYYGVDCREALRQLPEQSVHTVVTSPPYWGLRDYGTGDAQIGLEDSPEQYVTQLVEVFREVHRVLRDDGTLWLNLGDSYVSSPRGNKTEGGGNLTNSNIGSSVETNRFQSAQALDKSKIPGLKPKDLVGIPWRVALALQADGWYLRSDIIWAKGSCMPESVTDRPTKAHEYLFLLTKQPRYFYDAEAIREPSESSHIVYANKESQYTKHTALLNPGGRNKRSVWNVNPRPYPGAHFAVFPPELITPCVLAGTSEKGACSVCGAPWVRVVERPIKPKNRMETLPNDRDGGRTVEQGMERRGMSHFKYNEWLKEHPPRTLTWEPMCDCPEHEPVPCTVLDPFSGSATTGFVAFTHNRAFVGIDLNPNYLELAIARLLNEDVPSPSKNLEDQGVLHFFGTKNHE